MIQKAAAAGREQVWMAEEDSWRILANKETVGQNVFLFVPRPKHGASMQRA